MKIFAKRSKKTKAASHDSTEAERKIFQSDAIVEEILKTDESTWNSKQRRLVKRYRERQDKTTPSNHNDDDASKDKITEELASKMSEDQTNKAAKPEEKTEVHVESDNEEKSEQSVTSNSSTNSDDDNGSAGSKIVDEDENRSDHGDKDGKTHEEESKMHQEEISGTSPTPQHESKSNTQIDTDIQKLMENLNSKQRRKLMRSFERSGNVEELRQEAKSLLGINDYADKKRKLDDKTSTKTVEETRQQSPKKKRKGEVNWSQLPPEERLRREEQKRLQKEAAIRREKGEMATSKHRHPLNSERRRANRRKPKWISKQDLK
jgi:hypothetical protein